MGIENPTVEPLNTLGQPLVGPTPAVMNSTAVDALLDAYHKGFVTTNDILEHTGANAALKGSAEHQALMENLAPDAIAARKAQVQLAGAQANANLGLVQPTAELARKQAAATTAGMDYGPMLQKFSEYGNPPTYTTDADGKPVRNYQADAALGAKYIQFENASKWASLMLTPRDSKGELTYDPVLKRNVLVHRNMHGQIIDPGTPSSPNPVFDSYMDTLSEAHKFLLSGDNTGWHSDKLVVPDSEKGSAAAAFSGDRGPVISDPSASGMVTSVGGAPAVTPTDVVPLPPVANPDDPNQTATWLLRSGAIDPSKFMGLSNQDAVAAYKSYQAHLPVVQPAAPVPAPVAAPVAATVAPQITVSAPGAAPITIQPQGQQQMPSIPGAMLVPGDLEKAHSYARDVRASEYVKNWAEKDSAIQALRGTAAAYLQNPKSVVTTQNDIDLATAAMQIASLSPSGGGRGMEGYKIQRLEDVQPYLEQLTGLKGKILKEHLFEKGTRDRLIAVAERRAQQLEGTARGTLKSMINNLTAMNVDPNNVLLEPERQLIQSSGGSGPAGLASPVTGGASDVYTVGNRKVRFGYAPAGSP